jgi:hypothetical protein
MSEQVAISEPATENRRLQETSNEKGVGLVNFATHKN